MSGRFKSIATRLSFALIGVISLVLLIFAVIAAAFSIERAENVLSRKLQASLQVSGVALRIPIWNVDYFSAQGIVDALLLDEDVVFAHVVVEGVPVAAKLRKGTPGGDFILLEEDPDLMTGRSEIIYEGEVIGALEMAVSRASIREAAILNGLGILVLTVLIVGAVALTSILTARRYVARPLARLQSSASAIARGDLDAEIESDRNDEVGGLARDFDTMRKSIKGLVGELQEANFTLEQRVRERTAELTETSERLQLAMSMDGVGIWSADLSAGTVWWSREYFALMGRHPDSYAVSGTSWEDHLHPDDAERTTAEMDALLEGPETVGRIRIHFRRPDGSDLWVDSLMRIARDADGTAVDLTGLDVDVTEQLARERELERVSERLSLAMQIDQVGIFDADLVADTLWWSPEYTTMLGHDPETFRPIPSSSWEDQLHPAAAERTRARMDRFVNGTEQTTRMRQRMLRPDAEEVWLDAVMRVQRDEAGTATRLSGLAVDVTEQLQRERRLAEANRMIMESLRYASRIQSAMLPAEAAINAITRDSFLIWEPRDIVGGDFFWHHPIQGGYAIIVGDCTGHGVPGAFMTLIACGVLDRLLQGGIDRPGQLLSMMHKDLQTLLGQHQTDGDTDDGLDAGVCFISEAERKVVFSGARFSLFRNASGEVDEIRGDKAGIGYRRFDPDTAFKDIALDMDQADRFYLTTDGLIDQIGGARRLSFGKRRFRECISVGADVSMAEQAATLRDRFATHQGSEIRRDDVTVLGFAPGRG